MAEDVNLPAVSELAMRIAVHMEVHAALSTTTLSKAQEIDALIAAERNVILPQPVEPPDDGLVERAAVALFRFDYPSDKWERFGQKDYHPEKYRAKARAALDAVELASLRNQLASVTGELEKERKWAIVCNERATTERGHTQAMHRRAQAAEAKLSALEQAQPVAWVEGIETAPHATTVLASYFDQEIGEWIVEIFVAKRPSAPFTHWLFVPRPGYASPQPTPPASEAKMEVTEASRYMAIHDAAQAAYEAATPPDYRYSAIALRKAVDAGIAAALQPLGAGE